MNKRKYQKKLSTILLSIFLFVVVIVTFSCFLTVLTRQKAKQEKIVLDEISSDFDLLNMELLSAFHSLSTVSQSNEMRQFASSSSVRDVYLNAISAQKQIATSMLSGRYLKYCKIATLYIRPELSLAITQNESLALLDYAQRFGFSTQELEAVNRQLMEIPFGHNIVYSSTNGRKTYLNYITRASYVDNSLLFVLSIDKENFEKASSLSSNSQSDWFIFSDKNLLFAKSDSPERYKAFIETLNSHVDRYSPTMTLLPLQLEKNSVFTAAFSEIDWNLAVIYPSQNISLMDVLLLLLGPLLFFIICSLLFAQLIVKRLYTPIDSIVSYLGGGEPILELDEFAFIRNCYHQVTEKAQELDIYLKESKLLLSEQFFKSALLHEEIPSEEYIDPECKNMHYVVALAEVFEETATVDGFPALKQTLRQEILPLANLHYVNISLLSFALVIGCESEAQSKECIQKLFSKIGLSTHIEMRVAISDIGQGTQSLYQLYEQCNRLIEYRYCLGCQMFITSNNVSVSYYDSYYYPLKTETSLIQLTVLGKQDALTLLDEVLKQNLLDKQLSPSSIKKFIFSLLSTLNRIFQELHIDESTEWYLDIDRMMTSSDSMMVFREIREILSRIIQQILQKNDTMKSDIDKQMLDFIYEYYQQDISLDDIASELNVSPKYCSALFKKFTGNTFKKVLNEYRVEKAKEILIKVPDTKILSLASSVGFISSNTFIQVFKQYTGTTPRQFASNYKRTKNSD